MVTGRVWIYTCSYVLHKYTYVAHGNHTVIGQYSLFLIAMHFFTELLDKVVFNYADMCD